MSEELQLQTGWRKWWKLTRPHTLTASFVPVLLGTLIAMLNHSLNWPLFIAMLIASLFIQAATNMFNEYYDFKRGLDNENSIGIGGAIVRNGMKPSTVKASAWILYGIATLLGVYICMETSWILAIVGFVCMAIGYFYTGGPYPIAYTPLGELFSGFIMGMLIVLIAFYIQTGTVTLFAVLVSVPSMLLVAAIMMSNNIRDLKGDKENGRKTLAILVGRERAITILAAFFVISYLWITIMVFTGELTWFALLVWVSIKKPIDAIRIFRSSDMPLEVMPAMKYTAQTNTFFGLLLCLGFMLSMMF